MKKLLVAVPIIVSLIFACGGNEKKDESAQDNKAVTETPQPPQPPPVTVQKYKMKSLKITYEMEVMGIKTEMTQYIEDFGAKEANESFGKMDMGIGVVEIHTKTIVKDNYSYEIDYDKKIVKKLSFVRPSGAGIDFSSMSESAMKQSNVKKLGTEEFLGKTCDVYEIDATKMRMKGKYYIWNNIAIKTDAEVGGMKTIVTATKIEENPVISPDVFKLPEGFKIEEY